MLANETNKHWKIGYVSGSFDLFHIGHLKLLQRAKERCDFLIAGVLTDELIFKHKGKMPVIPLSERMEIIGSIKYVDKVAITTPDIIPKIEAWKKLKFDVMFTGDDHLAETREEKSLNEVGVDLVFFPYTKERSTTGIKKHISGNSHAKASIVVTCYNKEKYIAGMFDSILAQEWNNIEIVLVNDGSTDKTGEIITKYEPEFKKRGYSVIIINQKNSGVITAAKNGLLACTGDYFCIVDADDKLMPEYVSLPTSFLEKNKKFDYTMCNFDIVDFNNPNQEPKHNKMSIEDGEKNMLSCYLLSIIFNMPWLYMVRSSYLKKDFFKKTYGTSSKGTHEPGFNIPLMALNGKIKVIDKSLYLWNKTIDLNRHSYFSKYKDQEKHLVEYHKLIELAIKALPNKIANKKQKDFFISQAELKMLTALLGHSINDNFLSDGHLYKKKALNNLLNFLSSWQIKVNPKDLTGKESLFIYWIRNMFFTEEKYKLAKRIICYGVKGQVAENWLPIILLFAKTKFQIELWDKNGDGKDIKIPDFKILKKSDVLFVFPVKKEIVEEIKMELKKIAFKNAIFSIGDMARYLGAFR